MSHSQPAHLPIPSRVGNYTLLKTIGKGQFGYVKLAIHDLTRERVAIKVIQKNRLDEKTLKMVSREISIMKLLNHPNVIRLYEVIDSEIFLFLVMEYAAGGEIMDFIVTHGKLKERDARRIFRQVVEAIDYCHEVHVIHRDLKAENLLLDSQLGIKLIDFGLSNRWAPGELLKTFCGSPTYTAPELIKRQQYEGPEVDLWSLGVLLYVLVCGSLPFDGNTFQELFTKIINGQYSVPEHVSPECRDLIGRMLVVNPKQRATLDQVREHPWTRESGRPVPKAHVVKMAVPVSEHDMDQEALEELVNIGFERDYAIQAVLSNSYDDAAATYYLLVEAKKRRTPIPSLASTPVPPASQNQLPQRPPLDPALHHTAHNPSIHARGANSAHQHATQGHTHTGHTHNSNASNLPHQHMHPPHLMVTSSPPQSGTHPNGGSRAKSTSPALGITSSSPPGANPPAAANANQMAYQQMLHQYQQHEGGNPAFRGQGSRRRDRPDGKGHRRHHTVGTPGEFPVDEEDAQSMPPVPLPHTNGSGGIHAIYGVNVSSGPAYGAHGAHQGASSGLSTIQHAEVSSGRGVVTQPHSPATTHPRSPRKSSRGEDEDLALESEQLANMTIAHGASSGSTGSAGSMTTSTSTASSGGSAKRGKHMRMLSNPPPIDEEDEMYYPPQTSNVSAISSTRAAHGDHPDHRPARPTGGLQPRSATMRTEKTRHKDHSRPVMSTKKKTHSRRPSLEPDDANETTPLASSKELKRSSEKRMALTSSGNGTISPRGRKGSKGPLPSPTTSSSPPLSDEDAHMVSLNPSTPPLSPSTRSPGLSAEPLVDLKLSPSGPHPTNNTSLTPVKPIAVKKESRSIVTRVKGFFSRKSGPEPRQVRFSINENNTTHEPPEVVLTRIVDALKAMNLPNNHFVSPFCLKTETDTGVVLEVEICQLPIIHLIGVRFRRICGDAWKYTRTCKRILDLLDLNNTAKISPRSTSSQSNNLASPRASSSGPNLAHPTPGSSATKGTSPIGFSVNNGNMGNSGHNGSGTPEPAISSSPSSSGSTPIPGSSPSNGPSGIDPFGATSGKKIKRTSDKSSKKSKQPQHLTPDDASLPPLSPSKRNSSDADSTFNTAKFKDESPKRPSSKSPKLPTLHTSQWEDDESSSDALVS